MAIRKWLLSDSTVLIPIVSGRVVVSIKW